MIDMSSDNWRQTLQSDLTNSHLVGPSHTPIVQISADSETGVPTTQVSSLNQLLSSTNLNGIMVMGERQLQLFVHDNWLYIVDPENSMGRPGAFDYPASNAPVRYKPESFRDPPVERYDEPIELVDISSPKDSLEVEEMR